MDNPAQIISFLCKIHKQCITDSTIFSLDDEKIEELLKESNLTNDQIIETLRNKIGNITSVTTVAPEWKFIVLNFYCLHLLATTMKKDDLLSVSQSKDLRNCLKTVVEIGISRNLNPKLPTYKPSHLKIDIKNQYYMLRSSSLALLTYAMLPSLRYYTLSYIIQDLLVAFIQLAHCPVKKPIGTLLQNKSEFVMTEEFYSEVIKDQKCFQTHLGIIQKCVSPSIFLREIMILLKSDSPNWFKKIICSTLTSVLKTDDGLERILETMLAGTFDNSTSIWKVVEVMTSIIIKCLNSDDFEQIVGPQIDKLIRTEQDVVAFEKLYASIVKSSYQIDRDKSEKFLENLFVNLKNLSEGSRNCDLVNSKEVQRIIRIIHYVFMDSKDICIPFNIFNTFIIILFRIYTALGSQNIGIKSYMNDILVKFLKDSDKSTIFSFFDQSIFYQSKTFLEIHENLKVSAKDSNLLIEFSKKNQRNDSIENSHSVYSLCKSDSKLFVIYFGFLLNCLNKKQCFTDTSLLENEDEGCLSFFGKQFAVYEMLNICVVEGMKNKYFAEDIPSEMFEYFKHVFTDAIKTKSIHNSNNDSSQTVFTILLILQDFVNNSKSKCKLNQELVKLLKTIQKQTVDEELKNLTGKILENPGEYGDIKSEDVDEIDEIVRDIFDESIPMKGHGLIALQKLVSSKHPGATSRKQYIFTIFKENLCNRDTYIYQAAIKGLATIVDLGSNCTDLVLETLCDEYTDFPSEEFGPDANEMRLKIGEVLVQISKKLGEMAPKYKSILLNAFLNGTRDEDHLIRASALSNLGEICQVLGYKIGTILTEILVCVHVIISTDKHLEPRRAAVLLIRKLLAGLGPSDMLNVLQDDILIIYRTLRMLYKNEDDQVLALQAQLALEEINVNMKNAVFPRIEFDKINKEIVYK